MWVMHWPKLVLFVGGLGALTIAACINDGGSSVLGSDDDETGQGGGVGGTGAGFSPQGGSDQGGSGGQIENPCGSECGPEELCDGTYAGSDDDCDGIVDEGCPCASGVAQACFKGDPSYRSVDGCFDGSQKCNELGFWGDCIGGVPAHASARHTLGVVG